jgi:hypothetical protein
MRVITTFEGFSDAGPRGFRRISHEDISAFWKSDSSNLGEITIPEATRIKSAISRLPHRWAMVYVSSLPSQSEDEPTVVMNNYSIELQEFINLNRSDVVATRLEIMLPSPNQKGSTINRTMQDGWLVATKDVDDYFWVHHQHSDPIAEYYKCDQVEGLLELLSVIIPQRGVIITESASSGFTPITITDYEAFMQRDRFLLDTLTDQEVRQAVTQAVTPFLSSPLPYNYPKLTICTAHPRTLMARGSIESVKDRDRLEQDIILSLARLESMLTDSRRGGREIWMVMVEIDIRSAFWWFDVVKDSDDWLWIRTGYTLTGGVEFYKCDQIGGLVALLKTKIVL